MSDYPTPEQLRAWAEWSRRLGAAMAEAAERIVVALRPITEALRRAYQEAGEPYGPGDEGMLRWLEETTEQARAEWEAERRREIADTCRRLRGDA